ncbi:HD domain-containing phosphohydrolase [Vibrio sp. EJY3]|uniref:HD domain-containing phosphohydrolase n=1 Tax=Vibrio TaxID=662 RepID=UPI0035BE3F62
MKENPFSHFVADSILLHHERVDGQGYPEGLDNSAASKQVKLVSLCDALNAMPNQRPYRDHMSKESIRHPSNTFGDTI